MNDGSGLEQKMRQPFLLAEFDNDWIYMNNVQQKKGGYMYSYRYKDAVLCIDYFQDEFKFRWGSSKDLYHPKRQE